MFYYRVYGMTVSSEHFMEELPQSPPTDTVDIHITLWQHPMLEWESTPLLRSKQEWDDEQGVPYQAVYKSKDQNYRKLVYRNILSFVFDHDGNRLYLDGEEKIKGGVYRAYLYGAGLGYALHLKNIPLLHGSVVNVDGQAMAFVGRSTAGKSTTATAISQLGYHLMNDDVIPLYMHQQHETWEVAPGYRRMRLWQDASTALNRTRLDSVVADVPKHYIEIEDFSTETQPLKSIFILAGRKLDIESPIIERLSRQDSLMSLLPHAYFYNFYEPSKKKSVFHTIGNLVNRVAVYTVIMPHNLALLEIACQELVQLHQGSA